MLDRIIDRKNIKSLTDQVIMAIWTRQFVNEKN